MDLTPTDEQVQLLDAYDRLFADHANPDRVRAAEPVGFDKALWEQLLGTGAIDMAVPEGAGGWGASAVDLVLVAERFGRWVAPAPLIEAQVAARLLARLDTPAAAELLANVLAGRLVTIAPHRPRRGVARLVPGGAVADEVIVFDGTRLLRVAGHGTHVENLGAMPVADLTVGDDAAVLGEGDAARAAFDQAWDDALLLHAAALVGMGARALELGAGYATERHAFGVPIGSFQAVAHPLADSAAALDGARLLTWKAAWAQAEQPERAAELAAMAFGFAARSTFDATYRSLHVHGGYGFMNEYDVQLYYRRARAWSGAWASPDGAFVRCGRKRYAGTLAGLTGTEVAR